MFTSSRRSRRGVRWLEPGRRRRRRLPLLPLAILVLLLAAGGAVAYVLYERAQQHAELRDTAVRFATAWEQRKPARDVPRARRRRALEVLRPALRRRLPDGQRGGDGAPVTVGRISEEKDGRVTMAVTVRTKPVRDAARADGAAGHARRRARRRPLAAVPAAARPASRRARPSHDPRRRGARRCWPPTGAGSTASRPRPRWPARAGRATTPARARGALRRPARGPPERRAALRRAPDRRVDGRAAGARCHDDPAGPPARGGQRARRPARRRRRDAPARRRRARARRARRLRAPAAGSTFKIITLAAALQARDATPSSTYPGAHGRDALGRAAAQRERRVVRRLAHQLVRALVQLRLRAARREARRRSGWSRPPSASASTSARACPAPSVSRSRPDLKDDLAVGAARSARTATSPRRSGWPSVGATIANRGVRARRGSCARQGLRQRAVRAGSPARCAT